MSSDKDTQEPPIPPSPEELQRALEAGKREAPTWATHLAVNPEGDGVIPGPSVIYTDGTDKDLTPATRRLQFHPIQPPVQN